MISLQEFFKNNELKINVFKKKYMEDSEIPIDEFFKIIAERAASVSIETKKDFYKNQWVEEFLNDIWRPGGSIMSSLFLSDKKISVFNCTYIPIEGDSLEDIGYARYCVQKCAAYRQGIGVDFSKLRPKNSKINNSARISEGVIPWMISFDRIADEVGQRSRKPAILFSLSVYHPDILDFIRLKEDLNKINNTNISVSIDEKFMEKVLSNENVELSFYVEPTEELIKKEIPANKIFEELCKQSWKTGEPGIQFIDRMRSHSIQIAFDCLINGTNACSEKPLPDYGVCALASINLSKVPPISDKENFHSFLKKTVESIVRFMDNIVEYEIENADIKSPLKSQIEIVKHLREIGIGFTNLHAWLYKQNLDYNESAINTIEYLVKYLAYYAFRASINLAKERKPCPAWLKTKEKNILDKNIRKSSYLMNIFNEFPDLKNDFLKYGIRNGALLSIAPSGTISMTFSEDVISTGIEPALGWYYWRRTRAISGQYEIYFVLPEFTKQELLKKIPPNSEDYKIISEFNYSVKDNDGKIGNHIVSIIKKYSDFYNKPCAFNVNYKDKIKILSVCQKWVDAGISCTVNFPENVTVDNIKEIYINAYKNGLKCISVYRNNSRENILFIEFPKLDVVNKRYAPVRPKILPCEIFRIFKHTVLVGLYNNEPFEVFIINKIINESTGFIEKNGKRKYALYDSSNNLIIDSLLNVEVTSDEIQAITRLVSTLLRHGVPVDFVVEQLKKCGNAINSYPKMLSRVLKKYKKNIKPDDDVKICPECGSLMVNHDGCVLCLNCGISKCE